MQKKESERKKGNHPSRDLIVRGKGFGIAAGYEKSYEKPEGSVTEIVEIAEKYGPLPHSGYYGSGIGLRPFKAGQAGFEGEASWYDKQYGVETGRKSQIKKKGK